MKLSFSTKGWSERSWDDLVGLAEEMDFNGIEVYDVTKNEALVDRFTFTTPMPLRASCVEKACRFPCSTHLSI